MDEVINKAIANAMDKTNVQHLRDLQNTRRIIKKIDKEIQCFEIDKEMDKTLDNIIIENEHVDKKFEQ